MPQLSRGQKIKLADLTPALQLRAQISARASGLTFDFSCFGIDGNGQLSDDRYFVFYNQTASPEGAIKLASAGTFDLDLSRVPASIARLVFVATIDGNGTMANLQSGAFTLSANGNEIAKFELKGNDYGAEKAVMVAEVYKQRCVARGCCWPGIRGRLGCDIETFRRRSDGIEAAPPTAATAPPLATTAPVNLKKVELDKKMERQAPQLVSLAKKATVSLEKVGLSQHVAKVALCLDISASMSGLYHSGAVQKFAEKVLALGTRFDDDGAIDIFLFGAGAHDAGEMNVDNFSDFIAQIQKQYPLEGGTNYARAMQQIRAHYFGSTGARNAPLRQKIPVYVMFLTDGATSDENGARQQVQNSSYEPLFWQFMGLGKSRKDVKKSGGGFWAKAFASDFTFLEELDTMAGRYVDNANFFSVANPDILPDDELYDLLMGEYPEWVKAAPTKGLLG